MSLQLDARRCTKSHSVTDSESGVWFRWRAASRFATPHGRLAVRRRRGGGGRWGVEDAIAAAVVVVGVVVGGDGDRTQTQPFCSPPLATCRAPSPLTPPRHPLTPCAVSLLPLYLYTKYIVIIFCYRTSPPRYKHINFI